MKKDEFFAESHKNVPFIELNGAFFNFV